MPQKMICLVTGGTGFVGSHLVRRLVGQGAEVHLILREGAKHWRIKDILNQVSCHTSDLSNSDSLRSIAKTVQPTVIYHLATHGAYSYQNEPDRIIATNILGTWNLLKSLADVDYELFVNTGSSSEYGFKKFQMRETDILEPASYYAVAKCSQTLLGYHMARDEKKPIVTLRLFSVYGPHEEPGRFVPTLMKALHSGERLNLVSPETARDMIYVDDVVDAYLLVDRLRECRGEVINIGSGVQSSIKEVVQVALKVTGRSTDLRWGEMKPRTWDTTTWVADVSKARQLLGWAPTVHLEQGLLSTWEWFGANSHFYGGDQPKVAMRAQPETGGR